MHDIRRSAHGGRSHSFKYTDHVGVLNLNVGGEIAEPDLAGTTHDELERGCSDTSSLAGILNDESEIAGRRPSDVQLCSADRFAVPSDDQRILVVVVGKDLLEVAEGCRWHRSEESAQSGLRAAAHEHCLNGLNVVRRGASEANRSVLGTNARGRAVVICLA